MARKTRAQRESEHERAVERDKQVIRNRLGNGRSPAPSDDPAHAGCAEEETCGDRRGISAPHCRTIRIVRSDGPGANNRPRRAARHDGARGRRGMASDASDDPSDTQSKRYWEYIRPPCWGTHHTPAERGRGGSSDAVRSSDAGSSYSQPASTLTTTSSFDLLQKEETLDGLYRSSSQIPICELRLGMCHPYA